MAFGTDCRWSYPLATEFEPRQLTTKVAAEQEPPTGSEVGAWQAQAGLGGSCHSRAAVQTRGRYLAGPVNRVGSHLMASLSSKQVHRAGIVGGRHLRGQTIRQGLQAGSKSSSAACGLLLPLIRLNQLSLHCLHLQAQLRCSSVLTPCSGGIQKGQRLHRGPAGAMGWRTSRHSSSCSASCGGSRRRRRFHAGWALQIHLLPCRGVTRYLPPLSPQQGWLRGCHHRHPRHQGWSGGLLC